MYKNMAKDYEVIKKKCNENYIDLKWKHVQHFFVKIKIKEDCGI